MSNVKKGINMSLSVQRFTGQCPSFAGWSRFLNTKENNAGTAVNMENSQKELKLPGFHSSFLNNISFKKNLAICVGHAFDGYEPATNDMLASWLQKGAKIHIGEGKFTVSYRPKQGFLVRCLALILKKGDQLTDIDRKYALVIDMRPLQPSMTFSEQYDLIEAIQQKIYQARKWQ